MRGKIDEGYYRYIYANVKMLCCIILRYRGIIYVKYARCQSMLDELPIFAVMLYGIESIVWYV